MSIALGLILFTACANVPLEDSDGSKGAWLSWRGPDQNGTSTESNLAESLELNGEGHLWSVELQGRGTPVIAGDRMYSFGYVGEEAELQEVFACLDVATGDILWQHRFSDFLSDVIYDRYSIGSPVVDPETGSILILTTPGLLMSFSADGELQWQRSMMSEFGRLTFPNGRIGAAVIEGDLAIVHVISSSWGPLAPARDRFHAFDKRTGESVWISTPGLGPKDSSFSYPVLTEQNGRRVLIAGTGCGHIVCIDTATGDPVWRYRVSIGGVNSSVLRHGDNLIAIHGRENLDSSIIGRMLSLRLGAQPAAGEKGPVELDKSWENWRNELAAFTSSPVLVGSRVYQTVATGDLCCVDADSGEVLWKHKLAPDQIHASPLAADGKLYVPMTNGSFFIIRPTDEGPEILDQLQLEGNCLGAPAISNGRIFVHTTKRLYCFGAPHDVPSSMVVPANAGTSGAAARLQVVPSEVTATSGDRITFRVRAVDASGKVTDAPADVTWETAKLDASFDGSTLVVGDDASFGAGFVRIKSGELAASARVRIVPTTSYAIDFNSAELRPHPKEEGVQFASPPPFWLSAGKKWEVRDVDGERCLAKTLDVQLFQRSLGAFGHPSASNYTMQMDIRTDGNRRIKSTAGMINQRYLILLKGNHQELEVSSNLERIKVTAPFRWKPKEWYTLKSRVDVADDGSGVVRAKVWKRGDAEPDAWTLEVPVPYAHTHGSPGLWGFCPQSRFRVYVDNIVVTPND